MKDALEGMLAVVTGASSGIGRAIAVELAVQGAGVWLIARHAEALEVTAAEVRRRGGRAWSLPLDVSGDIGPSQLGDRLRAEGDGLDILVHGAGTHTAGAIADAPVADLDEHYRVNVRGPYLLTQQLLPLLRARRGQVVFVNSSAGLHARAHLAGYSASKHALKAVADALRDEVNPDGVRVLSVYPGRTATPAQQAIHAAEGKQYRPERLMQPEDVAAVVVHALTVSRTAEVTEISMRPLQKA